MILKVMGVTAPYSLISWMNQQNMLEERHVFSAGELADGVNLANNFQLNPFSILFNRIDDLVYQKQTVEANETWHIWEGNGEPAEMGLAKCEAQRQDLLNAIQPAFVPVTHQIRIEAIQ